MPEQFIRLEHKGREYTAFFIGDAAEPFEITVWTVHQKGGSRRHKRMWWSRGGAPSGRMAEVYALAVNARRAEGQ